MTLNTASRSDPGSGCAFRVGVTGGYMLSGVRSCSGVKNQPLQRKERHRESFQGLHILKVPNIVV